MIKVWLLPVEGAWFEDELGWTAEGKQGLNALIVELDLFAAQSDAPERS